MKIKTNIKIVCESVLKLKLKSKLIENHINIKIKIVNEH